MKNSDSVNRFFGRKRLKFGNEIVTPKFGRFGIWGNKSKTGHVLRGDRFKSNFITLGKIRTMKRILFLLATIAFVSCKQEKAEPVQAGEQPYFVFDQAVYYHKDVNQAYVDSLYKSNELSRNDRGLLQIITGNVPVNPADTLFVKNMDILEFTKKEIDPAKNEVLSKIFSVKEASSDFKEGDCKPVYGDVIVFRYKGKIVGTAKIDLNCKKQQMVGIRYSPKDFGKAGEYSELETFLKGL